MVIYRTGYVISYVNCPIIWAIRIKTEIALSITEAEYIALSQAMRGVLTFVSLMKEMFSILKLQGDSPAVLCILLGKPVILVTV